MKLTEEEKKLIFNVSQELTEEERELFDNYNIKYGKQPLQVINSLLDDLSDYYVYDIENQKKDIEIVLNYLKRCLLKVVEKRGLTINDKEIYEIDDIVKNDVIKDFNIDYYKDYNLFNNYVENQIKDMSAEEIENYYNELQVQNINFYEFINNYKKINELFSEAIKENSRDENNEVYGKVTSEIFSDDKLKALKKFDEDEDINETFSETIKENSRTEDIETLNNFSFDVLDDEDEDINETLYDSDIELLDYIKKLNSCSKLIEYLCNDKRVVMELLLKVRSSKLDEFYNKPEFIKSLKEIMAHDKEKHEYLYHGTQDLESAKSILDEGLGMMRYNLDSTSYSEMDMERLLLYKRGFLGEIGKDAIVIIDQPISEDGSKKDIVQELDENKQIHFVPSGLQGLDGKPQYIVDSMYIVGYIDKKNMDVIYNPRYYDYDKLKIKQVVNKSKSTQDLGKETLEEQSNTQEKESVELQIERLEQQIDKEESINME